MTNMAAPLLDDNDLLNLLQVVLKNGNLFWLIDRFSRFRDYNDVDLGISWLLQKGIIIRVQNEYKITPLCVDWRLSLCRKMRLKGIYRYLYPSNRTKGRKLSFDDPFLPNKFKYLKKG